MTEQKLRQFIIEAETWYADTRPKKDRVVAELRCGLDSSEGGTFGEWFIEWTELGGRPAAQLHVFDDSWNALVESEFHLVMEELARDSGQGAASIEEVVSMLKSRGWRDITQRTDPSGQTPAGGRAELLHASADETNDADEHDELHAAGAIAQMLAGKPHNAEYVSRWIDGLVRKHS